jgi:hypothetical protein
VELSGIEQAIEIAQGRWPHLELHIKTNDEACAPCPWCGGRDRWVLFDNGFYFCRPGPNHCGKSGWLDEDKPRKLTDAEIADIRMRRMEQKQREQDRRLRALERMAHCTDHLTYHENLDEQSYTWWMDQGMLPETILDYKLGHCSHCPTDREHRPSYTLPVWDYSGEVLWNIRHRLDGQDQDKYRPHIAGLGTQLANSHVLKDADYGLITEGSKKALCISQYGFPAVGVMGKRGKFKIEWLKWFPQGPIYIALDPDAQENADRMGHGLAKIGKMVYVASFPCKPDDWFINGGTDREFQSYLTWARRIH